MQQATVEEKQQRQAPPSWALRSKKYSRYFVLDEESTMLVGGDVCSASARKVFATRTSARIKHLRDRYGIPADMLPAEEDLWFEMSLRSLELLALRVRCKSSYERVLADHSFDESRPSLIERGFLRRRFIAYALPGANASPAATVFVERETGEAFLVVDDEFGNYTGYDGVLRNAVRQGYGQPTRQYLYCIEEVNAAIAKLDGEPPPGPMKRWKPVTVQRREGEPRRAGELAQGDDQATTARLAKNNSANCVPEQEGTPHSSQRKNRLSSGKYDSTAKGEMSRHVSPSRAPLMPLEALRNAPWCAETLIGLASYILAISPRPGDNDEEALRSWITTWEEPAQRLIAQYADVDSVYAWREINAVIAYMADPASPSWFQRGRGFNAPVTLLNVLNNFTRQRAHQQQTRWYSERVVAYDGPPWEDEVVDGPLVGSDSQAEPIIVDAEITEVTELDQGEDEVRNEPTTDTLPAVFAHTAHEDAPVRRLAGMRNADAQQLMDEMRTSMPELLFEGLRMVPGGGWGVGVTVSATESILITHPAQWYADDGVYPDVDEAVIYAQAVSAASPPAQEGEDDVGEKADQHHGRADGSSGELSPTAADSA